MSESVEMSLAEAYDLSLGCLLANGCDGENARAVTETMIAAERDGAASHGLFRLPGYVAALRSGKVDGGAAPTVNRLAPGVVQVDGHGGFAPLALERGRAPLVEATREQGIAALSLIRIHHFAALWVEIEALCEAGLAALACTAYMPAMAPAGGREALYGTNPMAFGWPRRNGPPVVFDQASAAMARGEVMIAAREGHELPPGVGLNPDGQATTDPNEVLKGVMLPFGGYKGSSIAMMVELLAAGLVGERFSFEAAQHDNKDGGPPRGGEFILALDPARFGDAGWMDHCEGFFEKMLSIEGVRLPGSRRHANRDKMAAGAIKLPAQLHEKIQELAGK
ncbi:MAG: Ldh family oxidoreductase [Pseudomonadota bacterium]